MFRLTRSFRFEAAHTLQRAVQTEASRRIHGHSYRAEVAVQGPRDPATGLVADFAVLDAVLDEAARALDHRLLDEVEGLGAPTLENLCVWIWQRLAPALPGLAAVSVHRDSLEQSCRYTGPGPAA